MTSKELLVLEQVAFDLQQGKQFYDDNQQGIGDYFFDSIVTDIESLRLYAGIHSKQFGLYRMPAKRFPVAIYYDVSETAIIVIAVLDLRRNPAWLRKQLNRTPSPPKTLIETESMCLALPAKIVALDAAANMATASVDNVKVEVSLALVDDVALGDYVLVHVGYALNKIDEDEALKTLALFAEAGLTSNL